MDDDKNLWSPRDLANKFGVSTETLRLWENKGRIKATKTKGGHRRYVFIDTNDSTEESSKRKIIYARVSSFKQRNDLERQVKLLQSEYPTFEIIKDIGSGINFKRRGLVSILESVFRNEVQTVVVAHKDRLCRFGFDLLQQIFKSFGTSLVILSNDGFKEPIRELAEDLLSIVTVFSARYHGSRKYNLQSKNKNLSKQTTSNTIQQMPRSIKILLQQGKQYRKTKITTKRLWNSKYKKTSSISNAK